MLQSRSTGHSDPRRRDDDQGAALVEFALVAPLLMAFLLGIVTMGTTYSRSISLNNGAREAARYGAVLPVEGDIDAWLNTLADVSIAATSGEAGSAATGQRVCVAYVYPDGTATHDSTRRLTEVSGVRTIATGQTCLTDSRPDHERRVQVTLERTSRLETVFFAGDFRLSSDSVARFERAAR